MGAGLLAWVCVRAARRAARPVAWRLAAVALVAGPVGAVFALSSDTTYHGATCGSALSASLLRGVPDDAALDATQRGCRERGRATVRAAEAYGAAALGVAALAAVGARIPSRRAAVAAPEAYDGPPAPGDAAVSHVLLVHDPAAAERLAAALRERAFDVRIDTHDGGWTWIVRGTETAAPDPAARAGVHALAAAHGAAYEGWEADTRPC